MTALDELWDHDDPAASEARFRAALESARAAGDVAAACEARTQLARSLGLQGRFGEAHAELDLVDVDPAADDRVMVRSHLERGRLLRSAGEPAASAAPFGAAWALSRTLDEDGLAVDAAHMLALVDAPPGESAWHARALEIAEASSQPAARRWRASLWNNIGWARFEAGDLDAALAAFEIALGARREQDQPREARIAEWCVARCLRALDRVEEALAMQRQLAGEIARAGDPPDGYVAEEIAECLLTLGRLDDARPSFVEAAALLGADASLAEREPGRIDRLRRLGGV